jgi:hypothetical protein
MTTNCGRCGDLIPEAKQKRKAKYCSAECRSKEAQERRESKDALKEAKRLEKLEESIPEDVESPYAQDVAQMRAAKAQRERETDEYLASQPKKKGNKSWADATSIHKRDVLFIPDMVDGRHPKDPDGHYTYSSRDNIEARLNRGYRFASRKALGLDPAQDIPGVSRGLNRDHIWVNEMVLLRRPLQHRLDKEAYVEMLTEAQTPDMDEAAEKYGLINARAGHFGKGRLPVHKRNRVTRGDAD